jgi:SAM-dependent methyltransferase
MTDGDGLFCTSCQQHYPIFDEVIFITSFVGDESGDNADGLISRLKNILKKNPIVYNFLYYAFGGLLIGLNAKQAIKDLTGDQIILSLGSGIKRIRPDVINIDFYPFKNVDILADIPHLPFADNSVDAVINEFVLEHVQNPAAIIAEIKRVLKPGGLVYIGAPFIESFHSSPHDYNRWTKSGLQVLMKDFQTEKIGIRSGPTSALISILNEWLALLLSFGSRRLEQLWVMFFMVVTSPLRLLDLLMWRLPNAENIAFGFYYLGHKK